MRTLNQEAKARRLCATLSQRDMAVRLGVTSQYINDFEHERRNFPEWRFESLAIELDIPLDVVYTLGRMIPADVPRDLTDAQILAGWQAFRGAVQAAATTQMGERTDG